MDEFFRQLLGSNELPIWGAGIIWSLMGIALVKTYYLDKENKFNLWYWLNDNGRDVLLGIILSLVILRLGDWGLQIAQSKFNFDLGSSDDFVAVMIVVSAFIQYKLHIQRKPISKKVKEKMDTSNVENKK